MVGASVSTGFKAIMDDVKGIREFYTALASKEAIK